MKKLSEGEGAVNFVSRRFVVETMYSPSIPSLASISTALLVHILTAHTDMEERNE